MANRETSVANAFETSLTAPVTASDVTFNVESVGSLTSPCYLVIDPDNPAKREYVYFDGTFTAATFVTSSTANRGLAGSTSGAQSHSAGAKVRSAPLAQHIEDLNDRVDTKATDSTVVHLAGAETITGAKTFSTDPILADGSSALSLTEGNAAYQKALKPQAYGATGDGSTDDRTALFNLNAAAAGRLVVVEPGTYLVSTSLTINAGTWVFQPGARIKVPDGVTLTVSTEFVAGHHRIFEGWTEDDEGATRAATASERARIDWTVAQTFRPEWFGATGNGTANDKPSWQRMMWAFGTTTRNRVIGKQGATYLFKDEGASEGGASTPTRDSHAYIIDIEHVDIDLNGAAVKLDANTRYAALVFDQTGGYSAAASLSTFAVRNGKLDGNRANNETQWTTEGSSSTNKGWGSLLVAVGYDEFRCINVDVVDTIHSGVIAANCTDAWYDRCTASGGYPMQFDVHADQAHYFKADKDYQGRSFFTNIDTVGGSHGVTQHNFGTVLDASNTIIFANGIRTLNAAESGIHFERYEHAFLTNFHVEVDAAAFSSTNVSDVHMIPDLYGTTHADGGTVINGPFTVDSASADILVGKIANVKVLKLITGLAQEPRISADNLDAVNCEVYALPAAPIGSASWPMTVGTATGCKVTNAALGINARTIVDGCTLTSITTVAVQVNQPQAHVTRSKFLTLSQRAVTLGSATLEAHVTDNIFKGVGRNCIESAYAGNRLFSRGNTFVNFGNDTTGTANQRAAIGGTSGALAGMVVSEGDLFLNDGTDLNAYNVAIRLGTGGGSTLYSVRSEFEGVTKVTTDGLLGSAQYDPNPGVTASTTSATGVAVDASLATTFVVPPTGSVMVRLSGTCKVSNAATRQVWFLHNGTADVAGTLMFITNNTAVDRRHATVKVTGLTPGSTLTWTWRHASSDGVNSSIIYIGGNDTMSGENGPAVMEVWAA